MQEQHGERSRERLRAEAGDEEGRRNAVRPRCLRRCRLFRMFSSPVTS